MKKFSVFLFSCFFASCAYHAVEPASEPAPPPPQKTFEENVEEELNALPEYFLHGSWIPVTNVWTNTNFKSFDYLSFFSQSCPAGAGSIMDAELSCDYSAGGLFRNFTIKKNAGSITVDFDKFGWQANGAKRILRAVWKIKDTPENFMIEKYDEVASDSVHYAAITITYSKGSRPALSAAGKMFAGFGAFSFSFNDLYYKNCPEKPVGTITIESENKTKVFFYDDWPVCDNCVPVETDDSPGQYKFCMPKWSLADLSEYLAPFLAPPTP